MRRAAVAQGLRITHLHIAEPLGSTVVLTLRGGSVADLVARQDEITLEITGSVADSDRPISDGVYFEVWSDDSQFIFGSGYSTRMSTGVGWRSPGHG